MKKLSDPTRPLLYMWRWIERRAWLTFIICALVGLAYKRLYLPDPASLRSIHPVAVALGFCLAAGAAKQLIKAGIQAAPPPGASAPTQVAKFVVEEVSETMDKVFGLALLSIATMSAGGLLPIMFRHNSLLFSSLKFGGIAGVWFFVSLATFAAGALLYRRD